MFLLLAQGLFPTLDLQPQVSVGTVGGGMIETDVAGEYRITGVVG